MQRDLSGRVWLFAHMRRGQPDGCGRLGRVARGFFKGPNVAACRRKRDDYAKMPREWRVRIVGVRMMVARVVVPSIRRATKLEGETGNSVLLREARIEGRQQAFEILSQGPGRIGDDQPGAGEAAVFRRLAHTRLDP